MVAASELRAGTVIKLDDELFDVVGAEYHAGGGQFGGMVFVRTRNLRTHHLKELRFHPSEKLTDVELERKEMEYLYTDGTEFFFMDPETFEQIGLSKDAIGTRERFLQPNMRIPVELYEGRPVSITFPPAVELKVASAPAGSREHDTSTHKTVVLENGMEVLAPHFIKEGDTVKIDVATGKYLERVRREGKRS